MNTLSSEAEQYFQELSQDREATKTACFHIDNTLDEALNMHKTGRQDIDLLLSLIPYIESGEGELSYKYIGETHRIFRILHIIGMEHKYQMTLFCFDCNDRTSLVEKYMLTLFAFRRLLFHLSDSSTEDAVNYLQQNPLSIFAVYVITQDDLILPNKDLYQKIGEIYYDYWSESERQLYLSLTRFS